MLRHFFMCVLKSGESGFTYGPWKRSEIKDEATQYNELVDEGLWWMFFFCWTFLLFTLNIALFKRGLLLHILKCWLNFNLFLAMFKMDIQSILLIIDDSWWFRGIFYIATTTPTIGAKKVVSLCRSRYRSFLFVLDLRILDISSRISSQAPWTELQGTVLNFRKILCGNSELKLWTRFLIEPRKKGPWLGQSYIGDDKPTQLYRDYNEPL